MMEGSETSNNGEKILRVAIELKFNTVVIISAQMFPLQVFAYRYF